MLRPCAAKIGLLLGRREFALTRMQCSSSFAGTRSNRGAAFAADAAG